MTTATAPGTDRAVTGALLRYRVMAFTTGTVLLLGTVALVLQKVAHLHHLDAVNFFLWMGHGYLFLLYLVTAAHLGLKLRWPWLRLGLVMAAGTVPTMSFVAEHVVTRDVRAGTG